MKKKIKKIASPVKSLRGLELQYQKEINKLGRMLIGAIKENLLPFLKASQSMYALDNMSSQLHVIFNRLNAQFTGNIIASFAQNTAAPIIEKIAKNNKKKFDRSVNKATGIDLGPIITTEGLEDFMSMNINKNVSLIKTLPTEYFKQIEVIVNNGIISGARYSTIAKEITSKIGSANSKLANRIKTIARNEVQTINSQLTLRRSESLGIKKGIYRTSEDERVRKCHSELNNVEFDLKKGAWSKSCGKFIQPGITDINCRCSYSPVIEL